MFRITNYFPWTIKTNFALKNFIFFCLISSILSACLLDETPQAQLTDNTNNPQQSDLDKAVHQQILAYQDQIVTPSLTIGLLKDGQKFVYGYGKTDLGSSKIPDGNTIYEIGSISKVFTAIATAMFLQENGQTIDQPVKPYLPQDIPTLQKNNVEVSFKHILTHTSGLPRLPVDFWVNADLQKPYLHYDSTMMYNYLKANNLQTEPFTLFEYSNLAMGLDGLILERFYHKSYEEIIQEKICNPLGMTSTKITLSDAEKQRVAFPYSNNQLVAFWSDMNAFKGAGALRSTVNDMLIFAEKNLSPDDSSLGDAMDLCKVKAFTGKDSQNNAYEVGLGWFFLSLNGTPALVKDGGTGGFTSYIVLTEDQQAVIVLFNSAPLDNSDVNARVNLLSALVTVLQ